jgi:hypothetical protein
MVWALRSVFMMLPDSVWNPGGRIDPPKPQPFDAFRQDALTLACPFEIVRQPSVPAPPRCKRA